MKVWAQAFSCKPFSNNARNGWNTADIIVKKGETTVSLDIRDRLGHRVFYLRISNGGISEIAKPKSKRKARPHRSEVE